MKKLLPILFVLIITSCSKEVPSDQLVERGDIYYEVNSDNPYTGSVKDHHSNGQLKSEGFLRKGKWEGRTINYFENGVKSHECFFGVEENMCNIYYESGRLTGKTIVKTSSPKFQYSTSYNKMGQFNFCMYNKVFYEKELPCDNIYERLIPKLKTIPSKMLKSR